MFRNSEPRLKEALPINLYSYRVFQGLSQNKLVELVNDNKHLQLQISNVKLIETTKAMPSLITIILICNILSCTPNELFGYTNDVTKYLYDDEGKMDQQNLGFMFMQMAQYDIEEIFEICEAICEYLGKSEEELLPKEYLIPNEKLSRIYNRSQDKNYISIANTYYAAPENMRLAREKRGTYQYKVAEAIGITPENFSKIEKGKESLTIYVLEKICQEYDTTPNDILSFSEKENYTLYNKDGSPNIYNKAIMLIKELDEDGIMLLKRALDKRLFEKRTKIKKKNIFEQPSKSSFKRKESIRIFNDDNSKIIF